MINCFGLEEKKWNTIVRSFRHYDVYYLAEYAMGFEKNGDGKAQLIYFEYEETRAVQVVLKRDIAYLDIFKEYIEEGKYFDFITPYGYGGFLVEGEDYEILIHEYEMFCLEQNIISEFVRFHPILKNHKKMEQFYQTEYVGNTVCIDTVSEDIIWKNFSSKNRNTIRKAQKSGQNIYWGRDEAILKEFIEIYEDTMKKNNAKGYYFFNKRLYDSILKDLKQNAIWFYSRYQGEITAMAIFLYGNGTVHYHLSASREKYRFLASTNLVLYEAAVWASNQGYTKLHMGGGLGAQEDSLYKFKKSFNREEDLKYFTGKKIYHEKIYNELSELRRNQMIQETSNNYFPQYRY